MITQFPKTITAYCSQCDETRILQERVRLEDRACRYYCEYCGYYIVFNLREINALSDKTRPIGKVLQKAPKESIQWHTAMLNVEEGFKALEYSEMFDEILSDADKSTIADVLEKLEPLLERLKEINRQLSGGKRC